MKQIYICAGCGYETMNLAECDHQKSSDGFLYHICPKCDVRTFHFAASPEIRKRQHEIGALWLCEGESWDCEICRQANDRPLDLDFFALSVPDGWQISELSVEGISIRRTGLKYVATISNVLVKRYGDNDHTFCARISSSVGCMVFPKQDFESDNWDTIIADVNQVFDTLEHEFSNEVAQFVSEAKTTARQKKYKPGWVWYRVKDKFGAEIANSVLPKEE